MNSLFALILSIVWAIIIYRTYGRHVDRKLVKSDPNKTTPATMYMDGVDFMPTSKNVLFGFQFKSICGLGPIVGAIIAVHWGWLPAMLYLLLGVALLGWIHDYTSAQVSIRKEGMSLGGMSYTLISPRGRTLVSIFIYFNLMFGFGAFALFIAGTMGKPSAPFGILVWIAMGLLFGQMIYKWKMPIITATLITVVATFVGIFVFSGWGPIQSIFKWVNGGDPSPVIFGTITQSKFIWVLFVLAFCYFGATLPIWRWAQPINYLGFWVVFIAMVATGLGILIGHPSFGNFPAYTGFVWAGKPLWPLMFVTLMCGAVSGWHSLVSSSGTARMIEKETDTLPVAGGAMFLEMIMGMIALIIAVSAFGSFEGFSAAFKTGGGFVFAKGMSNFLGNIGVPAGVALTYANVVFAVIGFTLIHLGVRFMRLYGSDVLGEVWPAFKNIHFSTIVSIAIFAVFCFTGVLTALWMLGGAFNQMLAAMALLICTCWLASERRSYSYTLWPTVFLGVTTICAAVVISYQGFVHFFTTKDIPTDRAIGDWVTGVIAILLVVLAIILAKDGVAAIARFVTEGAAEAASPPKEPSTPSR
ncbi:MAG: carbon starvation CstA family protein [Pseudomonadota bacterium]